MLLRVGYSSSVTCWILCEYLAVDMLNNELGTNIEPELVESPIPDDVYVTIRWLMGAKRML